MNKLTQKLLAGLLLVAMLVTASASCGKKPNESDTSATTTTAPIAEEQTTTTPETEPPTPFEALPKTSYGGAKFNILLPSEHSYEFAEEVNGEIVNDAIYERDSLIESSYEVDLNYIAESGQWATRDTFTALVRNSVLAQDGNYDLINGMNVIMMPTTLEGLYVNLAETENIRFDDPWWAANLYDTLNIAGKLYGVTGSSLLSVYKTAYVMYANTNLISEYKLEDPAELVLSGKWTVDKLLEMIANTSRDLDNNAVMNENDFYGYVTQDVAQRGFQTSMNIRLVEQDDDGKMKFLGATEKYLTAVDKLNTFFGNAANYTMKNTTDIFMNDRAIFLNFTIDRIELMQDMTSDFVLLPQPKYDEAQENYYVQMATGAGMFYIPNTVPNLDMTVDILNAHGALSYEKVVPAYYENALKYKYTRVENNVAVLDIINNSITMDVSFAFASSTGDINTMLYRNTAGGLPIASVITAEAIAVQKKMDILYKAYQELEQ